MINENKYIILIKKLKMEKMKKSILIIILIIMIYFQEYNIYINIKKFH
jgi:hypothetical protein